MNVSHGHHLLHDSPPSPCALPSLKGLRREAAAPPAAGLDGLAVLRRDLPTLFQEPPCLFHPQTEEVGVPFCSHFFSCLILDANCVYDADMAPSLSPTSWALPV